MPDTGTILTVSELTRRIKGVLEKGFTGIAVTGEISNFKRHSSGHLYFTLKDEGSQIRAVMWRARTMGLFFTPQDGMKVVARGNISVYEVRGEYQIDVVQLQPLGVGELQMAFEKLKRKLAAEGLFDSARKKPIPQYPERIGIVTSPTGAALRDMLNVIARRFPAVEVVLCPVRVQGAGAAEEIVAAIRDFNAFGNVDVLIVGRGGGSLEDLWSFNEESVARAIYASNIPIISAVGHEIDFTIADFVADLRAPTPSAAAELAVPNRAEIIEILRNFSYTARQLIGDSITSANERVLNLVRSYSFNRPIDLLRQYTQRIDELNRTLSRVVAHRIVLFQNRLTSLSQRIAAANPQAVLKRGYAIVTKNGVSIGSAGQLSGGDAIGVRFHDGSVNAHVDET